MGKITLILCFLVLNCANSQITHESENMELSEGLQRLILKENIENQKYFFKVEKSEIEEYELTYLGKLLINKTDTLRFLFTTSYSGLYEDSKKANSHLILYLDDKKIGTYYLGGFYKISPKIVNNNLVILNNNNTCNQSTEISFEKGIPSKIFINCSKENGEYLGDLYNFDIDIGVDGKSLPVIKSP